MASAQAIRVGRVVRPWGRHGAVVVAPLTHDLSRFERLDTVMVSSTPDGMEGLEQRRVRFLRLDRYGRPLLEIEGIRSINQAEELRGRSLLVPESCAERPAGVAYFNHELIGADVVTSDGLRIGRVEDIMETAGANLLQVLDGEREVLVPMNHAFVLTVDVAARRIVVSLPVGLIELSSARVAGVVPRSESPPSGAIVGTTHR